MEKKRRLPTMVISFLVITLLNRSIEISGTLLTADLMEVRSIPAGGALQFAGYRATL
jgi:hypothetical protein